VAKHLTVPGANTRCVRRGRCRLAPATLLRRTSRVAISQPPPSGP
jgi:hypothetical protein